MGYPGNPLGVFAKTEIKKGTFLGLITGEICLEYKKEKMHARTPVDDDEDENDPDYDPDFADKGKSSDKEKEPARYTRTPTPELDPRVWISYDLDLETIHDAPEGFQDVYINGFSWRHPVLQYINGSRKGQGEPNVQFHQVHVNGIPMTMVMATEDIAPGLQILLDYKDQFWEDFFGSEDEDKDGGNVVEISDSDSEAEEARAKKKHRGDGGLGGVGK